MREKRKRKTAGLGVSGADTFEERETEIPEGQAKDTQKNLKVVILSPDKFVRDFLHGILVFQGYPCIDARNGQDVFWNMTPHQGQVVFLDGLLMLGPESEAARQRAQEFAQAGMMVMVLADRRWDAHFAQTWKEAGCQLLWKPLDYRKVGEVMAQIGFEPGEV